ncbi:Synapse-associated protein 1 [Lobulomyces angularis]|nr:Synapse-associated protein 1 [Lobulomyces angularis]
MRFDLVPKQIKEPLFWRNYFYRVSLIKQAIAIKEQKTDTNFTPSQEDISDKKIIQVENELKQNVFKDNENVLFEFDESKKNDADPLLDGVDALLEGGELDENVDWELELQRELAE